MRALITGGAGFIGSHLAETLVLQGHHVTVLDDLSTGRLENIAHLAGAPGFRCIVDTVTSESAVEPLVDHADVVFHLAAAVGVKLVVERPIHTIHTNINGTETVLKAANRFGRRVLIASTSEVYGKGHALPFREDADLVLGPPDKIRWGYATSKLMDEFLAMAYAREHDLRVSVVRLFNTVGPRQSSRYGMVLPNFVKWALAGQPITIHGDGSQTRSFTWVGDVVWAMTALVNEPRAAGQVFNIGNGEEISIRDLARRVCDLTGSESQLVYTPYEQAFDSSFEDMPRRVPDISRLRRLLGYEPRVQLNGIIESVIRYWGDQSGMRRKPTTARRRTPVASYAAAPVSV
ncbi:MAG TPA: NAD-dependent epimerase/dehydratase family protein [Vicinamibacterales bacterium]|nr:NAD-dependent epimerase/dehydratase family protein [Vicinamibacterales bacterium]